MSRQSDAAKLLAIGLLNYADDEGYFYSDARMVRAALRAFDEDSTIVRRALDDLSNIGFIVVKNHVSHGPIGHVSSFLKHQRIDRAHASDIRALWAECKTEVAEGNDLNSFDERSTNDRRMIVANVALEGKGREGKGMDIGTGLKPVQKQSAKTPSKPQDEDEAVEYFQSQGADAEQAATFFDHFETNGWKQGGKTPIKDWRAAARNWIRRSIGATRGAAAGLGRGIADEKNSGVKLGIVGIDVGADEVAALEAGREVA